MTPTEALARVMYADTRPPLEADELHDASVMLGELRYRYGYELRPIERSGSLTAGAEARFRGAAVAPLDVALGRDAIEEIEKYARELHKADRDLSVGTHPGPSWGELHPSAQDIWRGKAALVWVRRDAAAYLAALEASDGGGA